MAIILTDIADKLFINRNTYKLLSDEDKETFFFIINRYLTKKYPEFSQKLNFKSMLDKSLLMDIIFMELSKESKQIKNNRIPYWFWSKSSRKKDENSFFTKKQMELLTNSLELKEEDILFLNRISQEELKEELKYLEKIQKEK